MELGHARSKLHGKFVLVDGDLFNQPSDSIRRPTGGCKGYSNEAAALQSNSKTGRVHQQ